MSAITGLFSRATTSVSGSPLSGAQAGQEVGKQTAERTQLETARRQILQGLRQITAAQRLVGTPPSQVTVDGRISLTPSTLFQRIDQAASSKTQEVDQALTGYSTAVRELRSRLSTLPQFSRSLVINDPAGLTAARQALARYAATSGDDRILEAGRGAPATRVDLSNQTARQETRVLLSDLAAELEAAREIYAGELASIELRLAGATGALAAARSGQPQNGLFNTGSNADIGITFADRRRDVKVKEQLMEFHKQLSRIGQVIGDPVEPLNAARAFSVFPTTMQDWLDRAQLEDNAQSDFRAEAIQEFNRLRTQIIDGIKALTPVTGKSLVDQDSISKLVAKLKVYADTSPIERRDPNALGEAYARTNTSGTTGDAQAGKLDFSKFGDAAGTTAERSEARRLLNEMTMLTRELQTAVNTELVSVNTRITASDATLTALTGGGGRIGSAVGVSAAFATGKRLVSATVKGLDRLIELVGTPNPSLTGQSAPVRQVTTLQDAITNTATEELRTKAASQYNEILGEIRKQLGKLGNVPASLLQDGDLATTLMNTVSSFSGGLSADRLREGRIAFQQNETGDFFDLSRPGDVDGTTFQRSQARRAANAFYNALVQARTQLDRELVSLTIQADIAEAQAKAAISALAGGAGSAVTGIAGAVATQGSPIAGGRGQVVGYLQEVTKIQQAIGQAPGAPDKAGRKRTAAFTAFQSVDLAADESRRGRALSSFNSAVSDAQTGAAKARRVGGINIIDRDGLERARTTFQTTINGSTSTDRIQRTPDANGNPRAPLEVSDLRLRRAVSGESGGLSLAKEGNSVGNDGGRSEARRSLSQTLAVTREYRTRLMRELFNQDSASAASRFNSAIASAAYTRALADDAPSFSSGRF
ncbi:MAG: hypothetical protein SF002_05850 [Alphaproteobacteria bacterium]|nr:hypothetical protein [Alphaproteobacteria bacterium]